MANVCKQLSARYKSKDYCDYALLLLRELDKGWRAQWSDWDPDPAFPLHPSWTTSGNAYALDDGGTTWAIARTGVNTLTIEKTTPANLTSTFPAGTPIRVYDADEQAHVVVTVKAISYAAPVNTITTYEDLPAWDLSPNSYIATTDVPRTTDIASQACSAILMLYQQGCITLTDALMVHAIAAVNAMATVTYSSGSSGIIRRLMLGDGGVHMYTYSLAAECLGRWYVANVPGVQQASVLTAVTTLAYHTFSNLVTTAGADEREQTIQFFNRAKHWPMKAGVTGLPAQIQLAWDDYLDTRVGSGATKSTFDGWEYHYNATEGTQSASTVNIAYYAVMVASGCLYLDEWVRQGKLTYTPTQLARLQNIVAHALGFWTMSGMVHDTAFCDSGGGVYYRSQQGVRNRVDALVAIALNPQLQFTRELPGYCRYLADRWLEHQRQVAGEFLFFDQDVPTTPTNPIENALPNMTSASPSLSLYIPGPNGIAMTLSEMAWQAMLVAERPDFLAIKPVRPDLFVRWDNAMKSLHVTTPRKSFRFQLGTVTSGSVQWPQSAGPGPARILNAEGQLMSADSARAGSVAENDTMYGVICQTYRHSGSSNLFLTSNGRNAPLDTYNFTDSIGQILSSALPSALDTKLIRSPLGSRVTVQTVSEFYRGDGSTRDTNKYNGTQTWNIYRDFSHVQFKWAKQASADTDHETFVTFPIGFNLGRAYAKFSNTGTIATMWDGTTATGTMASGSHAGNLEWLLALRDSRGETTLMDTGIVYVPVATTFTLPTGTDSVNAVVLGSTKYKNQFRHLGAGVRCWAIKGGGGADSDGKTWDWVAIELPYGYRSNVSWQALAAEAAAFAQAWYAVKGNVQGFRMQFADGMSWGGLSTYQVSDLDSLRVQPASGNVKWMCAGGRRYNVVASVGTKARLYFNGLDAERLSVKVGERKIESLGRAGMFDIGIFDLDANLALPVVVEKLHGKTMDTQAHLRYDTKNTEGLVEVAGV